MYDAAAAAAGETEREKCVINLRPLIFLFTFCCSHVDDDDLLLYVSAECSNVMYDWNSYVVPRTEKKYKPWWLTRSKGSWLLLLLLLFFLVQPDKLCNVSPLMIYRVLLVFAPIPGIFRVTFFSKFSFCKHQGPPYLYTVLYF